MYVPDRGDIKGDTCTKDDEMSNTQGLGQIYFTDNTTVTVKY